MSKYLSVIIGAIITLVGLVGLISWWCDFMIMIRGTIPAMLILGGIIAIIAGVSELRDNAASKK